MLTLPSKGKFEYNFNSFVTIGGIVVTIAIFLIVRGYDVGRFYENMEGFKANVEREFRRLDSQNDLVKTQSASGFSSVDERIKSVEKDTRELDNLKYRVTVTEQTTNQISEAVKDTQQGINSLTTDVKVMREILQRLDPLPPRQALSPQQ